jgi:hypothetical protein
MSLVDLGRFFSFLIHKQSVGLLGRGNKRTQTSMPRLGFEPTILVFEQAKTVHAGDRVAGHCDRQLLHLTHSLTHSWS